ncbi:MAG: diadenylate cyclase [Patescibacteria group bacterium]|nr:diadenylate cyclase [Patescibacteria group bacterium]
MFKNKFKINFTKFEKLIKKIDLFSKYERDNLATILAIRKMGASPELKLKLYKVILELKREIKKPFGLIIVLGWRREWNENYSAILDVTQNIFKEHHFDIKQKSFKETCEAIKKTIDFDGAILISKDGHILASGVYLENTKPKELVRIIHPSRVEDLSAAFGFEKKVHTRHLVAIAASFRLKNTTVLVFSEEDGSARIFEKGKIIWSTNKEEIKNILKDLI